MFLNAVKSLLLIGCKDVLHSLYWILYGLVIEDCVHGKMLLCGKGVPYVYRVCMVMEKGDKNFPWYGIEF